MSKQGKLRAGKRKIAEEKRARRVVNGIFIGLIILMVLCLLGYYLAFGNY